MWSLRWENEGKKLRRGYEGVDLVDHFDEMSDEEGGGLDSFEFFFGSDEFSFELFLVVNDVLFLDVEEFVFLLELFETFIEVKFFLGMMEKLYLLLVFRSVFDFHLKFL